LADLTGTNQHGFKRGKSTSTLSVELQSVIWTALDENEYLLMASSKISSAFDVVNTELLLKRMNIMGLPKDIINLINVSMKQ
jgi:hypothetical protein